MSSKSRKDELKTDHDKFNVSVHRLFKMSIYKLVGPKFLQTDSFGFDGFKVKLLVHGSDLVYTSMNIAN